MSSVNIDLAADTILNVMVGQQDENEVREVVFDFSDWYTTYGSGTISLAIQRPKDEWPYEGTLTVDNSTHKATWEISDTDSAYAGVGQIQLSYTVGTAVKKSVVYRFTVHKSLGALGNVITPIQIQTFIDEVTEALEDMQEELNDVKQDLQELQDDAGVTAELKSALLDIAENIAYINANGQTLYDNLYNALYPNASSITCVYTQTGTVYTTDTLNSLKDDLVVTAHYSDSTSRVLANSDYTLTGTLSVGTSTISVHYGDLVTTFTVTVTARTLSSISAVYTQSGTVYTDDDLDSLKSDLVVTATYNDSSTEIVPSTDYELSGTLASGTSTITVTYESKTTTFTVTVTAPLYSIPDFAEQTLTKNGKSITIKKENNRYTTTGLSQEVVYVYPDGTVSLTKSNTLWFNTPADKPLLHEIYDITWNNPNNITVDLAGKFSRASTTGNLATASYTMEANSSGTDASGQFTSDAYASRDFSGYGIQVFHTNDSYSNNVTTSFKVRLFCDGVRYL